MRTLSSLCFLAIVTIPACGSASSGAATNAQDAGPTSCTSAEECNPEQCVCTDGETFGAAAICGQGTCLVGQSDSFCASACKAHGGTSAIRPTPNVASSAECDAWCSKGAALNCGSTKCNRFFFCGVGKRSCEAAERAALECAVEKGTWACSKQGGSWSVSSSCGTFSELCTAADAGAD